MLTGDVRSISTGDRPWAWIYGALFIVAVFFVAVGGYSFTGGKPWQFVAFTFWCGASVYTTIRIWRAEPTGALGRFSSVLGATLTGLALFAILSMGWPRLSRDQWVQDLRRAADSQAEMAAHKYSVNDLVSLDDSTTQANRAHVMDALLLLPSGVMLIRLAFLREKSRDGPRPLIDIAPTVALIVPVVVAGIGAMLIAGILAE